MHEWEDDMMKKHAEIGCENGGDILSFSADGYLNVNKILIELNKT